MLNTLRVMVGSPEKSSLVFETARFSGGSITLANLNISSSLSLNSCLFSSLTLSKLFHSSTNYEPEKDVTDMRKYNAKPKEAYLW